MSPIAHATFDFGYPWWLSYGHLVITALALPVLFLAYKLRWSRWLLLILGCLALWSVAAATVVHYSLNINEAPELPTQHFLTTQTGHVLDLGAGTGRSSIMLLEARPQATLVALDLFADSYDQHFGKGATPQQRLLDNLKQAGVSERASIVTADMAKLPFEAASFDGIVSAYAVDHLSRSNLAKCLAESARVLKPGGEFLMIILAQDFWSRFTFGPLIAHGGARPDSYWTGKIKEAGLAVSETGNPPMTLYVLAKKPLT